VPDVDVDQLAGIEVDVGGTVELEDDGEDAHVDQLLALVGELNLGETKGWMRTKVSGMVVSVPRMSSWL